MVQSPRSKFMNNKGQAWGYAIMISITLLVLAMALAPAIKSFTDDTMNQTVGDRAGLDCNNDSISNYNKATCVITDFSQAYFIGGIILIALALITAKIVF